MFRPSARIALLLIGVFLVLTLFCVLLSPATDLNAIVRVVNVSNGPIAGATLTPSGLRAGGYYVTDWHPWDTPEHPATNPAPRTDSNGVASVRYPTYVFERAQTRVIILTVSHPGFVTSQVELPVFPKALPWGGSFAIWRAFFAECVFGHNKAAPHPPIVLFKGASLRVTAQTGASGPSGGQLRVLLADESPAESASWTNLGPETVLSSGVSPRLHYIQAVQIDSAGDTWFSDVEKIVAVAGQTNDAAVALHPGHVLAGRLDSSVTRPVNHGRLIVNISPHGIGLAFRPPQWHAWTPIGADGSFTLRGLPSGDLDVIALCDGFVSTNGPGKGHFHYPQNFDFTGGDTSITIGMERNASVRARVLDDSDKPLKGATVSVLLNTLYRERYEVVFGSDCYNTADSFSPGFNSTSENPFTAKTDAAGLAVIGNVPVEANSIHADHPQWTMHLASTGFPGQARREQPITLSRGQTNCFTIKLERRNHSVITQY